MLDSQFQGMAYYSLCWKLDCWASGLVIKLLEVAHGQWLHQNIVVHGKVSRCLALTHKDGILAEIKEQMALLEENKYLLEINLDNMDSSDGVSHEY